jgi:hypothetical protein
MQVSHPGNRTTGQSDEALAQEFAEYISIVADSVVRSQIKHDFSAIEELLKTVKKEIAPLQDTALNSGEIVEQLGDLRKKLLEFPERWRESLQRIIEDLGIKQHQAFEKNTGTALQNLSAATGDLIKNLQRETNRYLESISQTPAALEKLEVKFGRSIEDSAVTIQTDTRKAVAETENKLCSLMGDKFLSVGREIALCANDIKETRAQIQTELRTKASRLGEDIREVRSSAKADSEALSGKFREQIDQLLMKVQAGIQESSATNKELLDKQFALLGIMFDQMNKADRRILILQRWIWGLGGSTLLALIVILIKVFR